MSLYNTSFSLMADIGRGKAYRKEMIASLILPEPRHLEVVVAAWSYAIQYSADGYDKPNYRKALALLKQRHPS